MADSITEAQIGRFVAAWFLALDRHDPIETCNDLLATTDCA